MKIKYEPIRNYISFPDFLEKAGYLKPKKRIGDLGRAITQANKKSKIKWLTKQLDTLYAKLRKEVKCKKTS